MKIFLFHCVIIEKNYRLKFSESEMNYKKSHDRLKRANKNYPFITRMMKNCWDIVSRRAKKIIVLHIYSIPLINKYS